jgi:hypothetical protein
MDHRPSRRKSRSETALDRAADQLTVISGFSELLREGVYGRVTPKQARVLRVLTLQAREARLFFRELLEQEQRKLRPRSGI